MIYHLDRCQLMSRSGIHLLLLSLFLSSNRHLIIGDSMILYLSIFAQDQKKKKYLYLFIYSKSHISERNSIMYFHVQSYVAVVAGKLISGSSVVVERKHPGTEMFTGSAGSGNPEYITNNYIIL